MNNDQADFLQSSSDSETEAIPVPEPTSEPSPEGEPQEVPGQPVVTFRGNSYDLTALIGVVIGGVVLSTFFTCGLGTYCLPFVPIILGIVGLAAAKDSVEPDRTRLLSWISLGSGAAILLLIILLILLYVGFIFFAIAADSGF